VGLTTALAILPGGWVVVGSLPTSDGSTITGAGCLLVLNDTGHVVETFSGGAIDGPWDMTSVSFGRVAELFFTNVLNGTVAAAGSQVDQGTVARAVLVTPRFGPPDLVATTVIASGFPEELNSAALVIGPTGVALGRNDSSLFVADTLDNRIVEIPFPAIRLHSAGEGTPISTGGDLNGPLGLATAPDGNLLAANGGDGNLVEISPSGAQLGEKMISPGGAGALFGLAVPGNSRALYFVDDSENQLNVLK
jgi:DNA-binding beta-propeller fold protein YncE